MTTSPKADFLVFVYDGNATGNNGDETNLAFRFKDIPTNDVGSYLAQLEDSNYSINGCIELSRQQTHFEDANIMQPSQFLVFMDSDRSMMLDEIPIWDFTIGKPHTESIEDSLDDIPSDGTEEAFESSGGDADHD